MDKMADLVNIISTTGNHLVYLGENNDIAYLEANSGNVQVFGQSGNDYIQAQNFGSDTLDGGDDDDHIDVLNGSIGRKVLIGGLGDDEIDVLDTSGTASQSILPNTQVTVSAGEGDDDVYYSRGLFIADANDGGTHDPGGGDYIGFGGQTILTLRDKSIENFETVSFSMFSDSVVFADGNVAAGAKLVVWAGEGEDFIDGSRETNGSFELYGGYGYDTLIGGSKDDWIEGGEDADTMTGNGGADTFYWWEPSESSGYDWNPRRDAITDFNPDVDKLAFNGTNFGGISDLKEFVGVNSGSKDAVITINTNLFVATGKGYTTINDFYSEFVRETIVGKDSNNPGFYVFFNSDTGHGQLWYDPNMNKNSTGDETLIVSFLNVSASNQLARIGDDDFLFPTL